MQLCSDYCRVKQPVWTNSPPFLSLLSKTALKLLPSQLWHNNVLQDVLFCVCAWEGSLPFCHHRTHRGFECRDAGFQPVVELQSANLVSLRRPRFKKSQRSLRDTDVSSVWSAIAWTHCAAKQPKRRVLSCSLLPVKQAVERCHSKNSPSRNLRWFVWLNNWLSVWLTDRLCATWNLWFPRTGHTLDLCTEKFSWWY